MFFLRFLVVGGGGFVIDSALTMILIHMSFPPWVARCPAIGIAMLFTWAANRKFTFRVKSRRSLQEGVRYALVAIWMAIFNYLVFVALVYIGVWPMLSIVVSTASQAVLSYRLYQKVVFKTAD